MGAVFAWQSLDGETTWGLRSRIGQGSDVVADPREATTERYQETVIVGDSERREEAVRQGDSHIDAVHTGGGG